MRVTGVPAAAAPAPQAAEGDAARVWLRALGWLPLAGVVALSLAMNTWSLSVAGYGNTYYAAAVRSMTMSWKNFFYGAFDPGGFITVDKPPVFLWVGALSARVFGYSTWSILLPSAFAGAASVALLWLIVRRYFGVMAATIAALALALTPVSVAVDRLNLPEPFMILALVAAAGALLRSFESRRWLLWTLLAGALVGVAFNTKMLAAWIPGPALALAVVVATRTISKASLRELALRLGALALATLIVSGSWLVVVDAIPASQRPYIGGSTDNTVLDLAVGYNGFGRVDGNQQGVPGGGGGARNIGGFGRAAPSSSARGGFAGPGGIFGGLPSWLRMFDDANGGQIGWLLPLAVIGGLFAAWEWRRDPVRRAFAVLFTGWIVLYAGVFSYAQGIFHSYYTSAIAPAVAAMTGIAVLAAIEAVRRDRRWLIAIAGVAAITLWAQLQIAGRTPDFYGWVRPLATLTTLAGLAAVAVLAVWQRRAVAAGVAVSVVGLLLLPAAWSVSAVANASLNATLPQAGPQAGASGATFGSAQFDDGTPDLAAWLQSQPDGGTKWQLVVANSQSGSPLIARYGISVMSLGGFLGRDDTISVAGFSDLVARGEVRYVLANGFGGRAFPRGRFGFGGQAGGGLRGFGGAPATSGPDAVMAAVQSACTPVRGDGVPARYQGQIYDCAGHAGAIEAAVR